MLTVKGCDFLGNSTADEVFIQGSRAVMMATESAIKLGAIRESVSEDLFSMDNCVTISAMVDLMCRWFMQHTPDRNWIKAYWARWEVTHRRGRKKKSKSANPELRYNEIMAAGFESIEEFVENSKASALRADRRLRNELEHRDITFDEASPIPEEWIRNGSLSIPVDKRGQLG